MINLILYCLNYEVNFLCLILYTSYYLYFPQNHYSKNLKIIFANYLVGISYNYVSNLYYPYLFLTYYPVNLILNAKYYKGDI